MPVVVYNPAYDKIIATQNYGCNFGWQIEDVDYTSYSFYLQIRDKDKELILDCTAYITKTFVTPDTHIVVLIPESAITLIPVGEYTFDVKMVTTQENKLIYGDFIVEEGDTETPRQ